MRVLKLLVVAVFAAALTASFAAPTPTAQSQTEAPAGFDNQTNGFTPQAQFDADRAAFEEQEQVADGLGPVYNTQSCAECHQNPVTGGISQIFELRAGRGGGAHPVPTPTPTPDPGGFGDDVIVISPAGTAIPAFFPAPGGSLIQARAINPLIQESVIEGPRIIFSGGQQLISVMASDGGLYGAVGNTPVTGLYPSFSPDGSAQAQISAGVGDYPAYSGDAGDTVRTFRSSLNILGDGFVEAIDDSTLLAIRDGQPSLMRGTAISVPLLEAPGQTRLGRFGWKNSVASLLSFSAGAYLFESGITSPLLPNEQTSLGRDVMPFDTVADPEDTGGAQGFGEDVEAFTRFMRSTKAPPRDRDLVPSDATDPGSQLFDQISCSVCHVRSITTAPAGTVLNGSTFIVPPALGDKVIHPFSDFLLHNIGTGDGIVETNGLPTWGMVRTAPLWGLRTRERLMHDGGFSSPPSNSGRQSFTLTEAILRHAGQAAASRNAFQALTPIQKTQLLRFLRSL